MLKPRYSCLFVAHRIPFPPDKGEKLRALAWLKRLSTQYDVTLLAGVDDLDDWRWRADLEDIALEVRLAPAGGLRGKMRGAPQLVRGRPLSPAYFRNPEMARRLREETAETPYDLVFVSTANAAAYLDDLAQPPRATIIDFVEVDSAKWEALAQSQTGPMSWVYAREGAALKIFEAELARRADASLFATEADARLFAERTGVRSGLHVLGNGVDAAWWAEAATAPSPYAPGGPTLVISGSMDQAANIDAALWLHDQVLPLIRREEPDVRFVIAGARPSPEIEALANSANIVTGRVQDLRPWIAHATLALAPMRVARGAQNKVLEAMAAGAPLLASPQALTGVDVAPNEHVAVAEGADAFAAAAVALLRDPARRMALAAAAQTRAAERHDWDQRGAELETLAQKALAGDADAAPASAAPAQAETGVESQHPDDAVANSA